jgi:carboxypeptidase Q
MHRLPLTAMIVITAVTARGQVDDSLLIRKLADEILVHGKAYDNLRELTKTIGQRLSGSPQTYLAEAWAKAVLMTSDADSVWLQQCRIPHWVRGGKDEAAMIAGNSRSPLDVIALGNSTGTGSSGLTAPLLVVNSFDELELHKGEVKGKVVFYNYPFNPRLVRTFQAYADAVVYRAQGASRAAKYGAVAVLVRSMTESVDNAPHTGAMRYDAGYPMIPALAIGLWDADKLASAAKAKTIQVWLKTNAHTLPDTVGYNVIGELRGKEFPDQYITVGGHLDSWDPAEGAQDDGAGCVHSIEVLRALKAIGYVPRHSIRVVLFSDEENHGGGAAAYSQAALEHKEVQLFGLESDAGGFTPRAFSISASKEQWEKLNHWLPLFKEYGVYEFFPGGGGADVEPLGESLHIPVGELIPDSQRYFDIHHSRNDVFENVNKRELELGAINMAALIYLMDKYGF